MRVHTERRSLLKTAVSTTHPNRVSAPNDLAFVPEKHKNIVHHPWQMPWWPRKQCKENICLSLVSAEWNGYVHLRTHGRSRVLRGPCVRTESIYRHPQMMVYSNNSSN